MSERGAVSENAMRLAGYSDVRHVYTGRACAMYKAVRLADGCSVLLKIPVGAADATEWETGWRGRMSTGDAMTFRTVETDAGMADEADLSGYVTLDEVKSAGQVPLAAFYELAEQLTKLVDRLHRSGLVHRNLHPATIAVREADLQCLWLDASYVEPMERVASAAFAHPHLPSLLPYLAPEQTGRLDSVVDYRSDIYAIGLILYELLTGSHPVSAQRPEEWLYGHLAQAVSHPGLTRPELNEHLCQIVLKCLNKQADDRYRSIAGLRADLRKSREVWDRFPRSATYGLKLGERDPQAHLAMTAKLFGRGDIVGELTRALEDGQASVLFVSGRAGVGKSSLTGELRQRLADRLFFVYGKCDGFNQVVPYQPLMELLRQMIDDIFGQSPDEIEQWKLRIQAALGDDAAVITEFIPRIAMLLGESGHARKLPFVGERQRFHSLFVRLMEALLHERKNVVIIVDDLQWASAETLALLEEMMHNREPGGWRLWGLFRSESESAVVAVRRFADGLTRAGIATAAWELPSLTETDVCALVAEVVQCGNEAAAELGGYLFRLTSGNPQFVRETLVLLHAEGWLAFDFAAWKWTWDLSSIRTLRLPPDLFELLQHRSMLLSARCRELLELAACVGRVCALSWLGELLGQRDASFETVLKEAVDSGLVVVHRASLHYVHDRMHQFVYENIQDDKLSAIHRRIADFLDRLADGGGDERLFERVNHRNLGHSPLSPIEMSLRLAGLNLEAGCKAKAATANRAALNFFAFGIALLPEDAWTTCYELMFRLHIERLECEYLCGHFPEANAIFDTMMAHVDALVDRARIHSLKVMIYRRLDLHTEAVTVALEALRELGFPYPLHPSGLSVVRAWRRAKRLIRRRGVEELQRLPRAQETRVQVAVELMAGVCPSTYLKYPYLTALLAVRIIELTIRHGNMNGSALGYSAFGIVCVQLGDYDYGVRMGELGLALADLLGAPIDRHGSRMTLGSLIGHWRYPVEQMEAPLLEAADMSMAHGDWTYAGYTIPHHMCALLFRGVPLADVEARLVEYERRTRGFKEIHFVLGLKLIRRFLGEVSDRSMERNEADMEKEIDMTGISERKFFDFHFYAMLTAYLKEDDRLAETRAAAAFRYTRNCMGVILLPDLHLFRLLLLLGRPGNNPRRDIRSRRQIRHSLRLLDNWAAASPANFAHKALFARAEMARVRGRRSEAGRLYEGAAQDAAERGYLHMEAIIRERAGLFYEQGKEYTASQACLRQAYRLFLQWGAVLKCAILERKYPWFAEIGRLEAAAGEDRQSGGASLSDLVGTAALVDTSQALSSELELTALLKKLMTIVVQTVGAERGHLYIAADGELVLEASGLRVGGEVVTEVLQNRQLDEVEDAARSVIRYVANTRETVVLAHAVTDAQHAGDPHIDRHRVKSLYAQPLIQHNRLYGVLYLENNLTAGVFTEQHVRLLGIILSHIAISIENARLYANVRQLNMSLEAKVRERTESLRRSMEDTRAALDEKAALEERGRIIGEIHDTIGHTLTTVHIQLEAGKRLIEKNKAQAIDKFELAQTQVRTGLQDIKKVLRVLKGNATDRHPFATLGDIPSLETFVQETMRKTGVRIDYRIDALPELPLSQKYVLYRALQEGLTNGIYHGESKTFRFTLAHAGNEVRFELQDDGRGGDTDTVEYGLGLSSMKRRVAQCAGELTVETSPGQGFALRIRLPYRRSDTTGM